jgi:RNA polymerase sigma factor (sigma-70 family)
MDDWQLLQDYAQRDSEEAFRALVERHLPLVHAAALRQVNDAHLAQEVTQAVFILLAQKAGSMRAGVLLPGWLFRTTRFVATRAARSERRRREREQEAFEMQQTDTSVAADLRLSPLLDEALLRLHEMDRNALLLRFAQERSLRDVGRELGLSEEATRKRVSRALERLRSFFARRGFTVSILVLAGVLSRRLVAAPPEGLAHCVVATSMANCGLGSGSVASALVQEALNAWRWSKFKLAGGLAVSAVGLALTGLILFQPSPTPVRLVPVGAAFVSPPPQSTTAPASQPRAAASPRKARERLVHFHVVAKDTGEPIANAPLAVNTVTGEGWKQRFGLSTDATGRADVSYPWTTARLDVGVLAGGWSARFVTWRTDLDLAIPADYTLRLDRVTTSMGGRLRDEKGQPVANAVIQMEFGGSDMAQEENPYGQNIRKH